MTLLRTESKIDEHGNKILDIYSDDKLISHQVRKSVPDSEIEVISEEDNTVKVGNSLFYLPNYKDDLIQGLINESRHYFSNHELIEAGYYLTPDSVVVDAGANIGNHTLYFANECKVKKIYAFEPVPYTYKILKKNIELNNLQNKVLLRNAGLSDKILKGSISSYDTKNLGGTRITDAGGGKIELITLDSLNITVKIDFIKIDVESMDYKVLCGAKKTILRDKPVIMIESFDTEFKDTDGLLKELGYKMKKELGNCEYIYTPDE